MFELITGSMYSGKTEELLRRIKREALAGSNCLLVRPLKDNRYENVETHYGYNIVEEFNNVHEIQCTIWELRKYEYLQNVNVIGFDEIQFFEKDIISFIEDKGFREGKRVVGAGLDLDTDAQPMGQMGELLAKAKYVTKVHAICEECGRDAYISKSLTGEGGVGNHYKAVCELCYYSQEERFMSNYKVFLDDERNPPNDDWVVVRNVEDFKEFYNNNYDAIFFISFDHDLGTEESGYDAMVWLEKKIMIENYPRPSVQIHTANPSAVRKMMFAGRNIDREGQPIHNSFYY